MLYGYDNVCTHPVSRMDGWMLGLMDRSLGCGKWRSVGQYSLLSLSVFEKEEMARQKLKRKRLSQPWRGAGCGGEQTCRQAESTRGRLALTKHRRVMWCPSVILNTQILQNGNSPGGGNGEHCISTFTWEEKTHLRLMMLRKSLITSGSYLGVTDVTGT